jgi:ubiquinone/menaquinone biosynthesis C-methylase UbiE
MTVEMTGDFEKDVIGWDIKTWKKGFPFFLANTNLDVSKKNKVLELGCGGQNGGVSLWLASLGFSVICSDVNEPNDLTKELHAKYGYDIEYKKIDAITMDIENKFDLVVFKSMIGGVSRHNDMEQAKKVLKNCYRALCNNGEVWFLENASGCFFHKAFRKKFGAGKNKWSYYSVSEYYKITAVFDTVAFSHVGFLSCFSKYSKLYNVLVKLDEFLERLIPFKWKYVIFGLLKKK